MVKCSAIVDGVHCFDEARWRRSWYSGGRERCYGVYFFFFFRKVLLEWTLRISKNRVLKFFSGFKIWESVESGCGLNSGIVEWVMENKFHKIFTQKTYSGSDFIINREHFSYFIVRVQIKNGEVEKQVYLIICCILFRGIILLNTSEAQQNT